MQIKTTANKSLVIAFIVVVLLFLFFGGWGMTGGEMNSGMHGGMNENGWISERGWTLFPTTITLFLGVVIGLMLFKKKN